MYSLLGRVRRQPPPTLAEVTKNRLIQWRREPAIVRVDKPTKLVRARSLGYSDKQGFVVVRVRVRRGGFSKLRPRSGRRQKAMGVVRHKVSVSLGEEAISRLKKVYPNMHPLGTYLVGMDGRYSWFEAILLDPYHPSVNRDRNLSLPRRFVQGHTRLAIASR